VGVRRRGRELALQMLYQRELSGAELGDIASSFGDLHDAPAGAREFALELVQGVVGDLTRIDGEIAGQTDHLRLERMAAVDRNIIRVALFELIHHAGTPKAVVIDEAVELAKRFGSERSGQFVNGILDGYAQRTRAAGEG
jgi:transcription antitermination protein NusB